MTETTVTIPPMPLFAYEITDEMKAEFLELIYGGHKANTAAEELGTTGTQMRKFRSRKSRSYDPEFAAKWLEAEESDEHRINSQESLRALVHERSHKSDSVLIKRAMAELPEWEPLRHQNFHHDHAVRLELIQYLSPEELENAIARAEQAKMGKPELKLLEAGKDDQ